MKKIKVILTSGILFFCLSFLTNVTKQSANAETPKISGRFIMKGSNCAGFNFKDSKTVWWTNELSCSNHDILKLRWIDNTTFMTRDSKQTNQTCPPLVNLYKVIKFDGKNLTIKSIWTGWNDFDDEVIEFVKKD